MIPDVFHDANDGTNVALDIDRPSDWRLTAPGRSSHDLVNDHDGPPTVPVLLVKVAAFDEPSTQGDEVAWSDRSKVARRG
jgi:hypothetical protein